MALIHEDGSGVSGAESYFSISDVDAFFLVRGNPAPWGDVSTTVDEKEVGLRMATDYLEALHVNNWRGQRYTYAQGLSWPRLYVEIDHRTLPTAPLPQILLSCLADLASALVTQLQNAEVPNLTPDETVGGGGDLWEKTIKIGSLEKSEVYANAEVNGIQYSRSLISLRPLLLSGNGARVRC